MTGDRVGVDVRAGERRLWRQVAHPRQRAAHLEAQRRRRQFPASVGALQQTVDRPTATHSTGTTSR